LTVRRLLACSICAACLMANAQAPAPAPTEHAPAPSAHLDPMLAGLEPVSDTVLAESRGGFTWEGVEVGLGAEVRTYLNGELVLQSTISWGPGGAQSTQTVSASLTPAGADQLKAGILSSGGITMHVGDQSVFLANAGETAIMHRTDGELQNILINRASNVTARQEIDAALDLQNFGQFQKGVTDSRLGETVGEMVGQMTLGAVGN